MRVLAIDTALAACSAAVLDTDDGGIVASQSLPMTRGHAEALMPLLVRLMQDAGMAFRDIDRVVVTTGPGSFTGLRVGIAAARGIALAAGKPAVGLSTLAAYAAPHMAADETVPVQVSRDLFAAALSEFDAKPALVDARAAPDITWVARMGAVVPEGKSPPKPQYLRAPDAQPQNAARLPRR